MVRTGGKGLGARCGPGAGTLNRRSPAGGSRAAAHRAVAERESRTRGPCERIRTKRRGWCAFRAAGNGANDDANPYGNLAWQLELDPAIAEAGRAVRSLLIGPGATHVIQALGLTDAVVVDTNKQGTLRLPVPEGGVLGNESGVRVWKGDFLELPDFFAPFDQIVMCSCFEGEWASSDGFQDKRPGEAVGRIDDDFATAWLCKCADLLRPGGIVVFQELLLGDNSKAMKTFGEIAGLVSEKLPYEFAGVGEGNSLCLRLPEDYHFSGSPLRLKSKVVHGFQRGSKQLGFPTANLHVPTIETQISGLKRGVYFGWAKVNFKDKARSRELGTAPRKVVVNVGQRPSFEDGTDVTIEVHVIGEVVEDFYGEEMRVVLLGFIRPEMKFDGIQGLVSRIRRDIGIGSKMLDVDAHKAFAVDAFVNGRNASYSYKAFEINGKWTTSKKVLGWTLFRIVALRKNRETGEKQVELMAVCDKSKRLFVDKKALKKDPNWQPGWFDP